MTELQGAAVATTVLAAVVTAVSWAIGLGPSETAVVASVVVTVGAGQVVRSRFEAEPVWPQRRLESRRLGTRREVEQLRWTLSGRRRMITEPVLRRLRAVAVQRLGRHGVDLTDPGQAGDAAALLGAEAYGVLIADLSEPVDHAAFVRCLAALERLGDVPDGTAPGLGPRSDGGR